MSRRSIQRAHARRLRRSATAAAATAAAAAALAAPAAEAATFPVSNLSDSGPGSLRQAILDADGAAGADTITFQSGLSGTVNVGAEMAITDDLTITGPGSGALTLDGGDAGRIFNGSGAAVSISGLTLTNGDAGAGAGGAASFTGPSLTLDDVTVTGSQAGLEGGGVYFGGNNIAISDSRFSGNSAGYTGGGFSSDGYNYAGATDAISITGSTFTGNDAEGAGGGIALYDNYVDVRIDRSTIAGNTSTGPGAFYQGGGVWFEDTYDGHSTTLSNSTVTGNSAEDGGGGVSFGENFYGPATVINSTITANTTAGYGGGINFADMDISSPDQFTLIDSTVTGNQAAVGGGVFRGYAVSPPVASDSPLDVSSSVVAANTATGSGADFAVGSLATGDLNLGNVFAGDVTGVTYTADPAGSNIIGGDPMLGPLAANGGPTQTRLPQPGSPLIDAGLANGLTTDQRGDPRTVEIPSVPNTHGSDGTDIGATELGDTVVTDPYLAIASPQEQGKKKIKVEVVAGAGELVNAQVWGKIFVGKGNAVAKTEQIAVQTNGRTTITVNPKKNKATKRILRALANGRKVTARLTGKLADEAGNEYQQDLQAKLKPKK